MIPSSTRMWLGSAILASLLLASSLTTSASSQTATASTITRSSMKPVLTSSTNVPVRTYTETVRKQMLWISSPVIEKVKVETNSDLEKLVTKPEPTPAPVPSDSVTVVVQNPQPSKPTPEKPVIAKAAPAPAPAKPVAKSNPKPVQVAASPQQQVSRSDSSALVKNALSLVGVPYLYGGTTRSGFDCSGFTLYVFKGSGISLSRTAASQFTMGSSVSRAQLQAGDLVFFTTYASGASHVGIYIGGGSFVHASNSGVRTTSLSDSYYASRYLGARRVS